MSSLPPPTSHLPRGSWRRRLLVILSLPPALLIVLATAAPWGWWPAELASHWAPFAGLWLAGLWLLAGRGWNPALILGGLALLGLLPWLKAAWRLRLEPASADDVQVAMANLAHWNARPEVAAAALLAGAPDLVLAVEASPRVRELLAADRRFPHGGISDPRAAQAMVLRSRFPVLSFGRATALPGNWDLAADVLVRGRVVRVLAIHPPPPTGSEKMTQRNQVLAEIAEQARIAGMPVLLLGDWNCSPGSPMWGAALDAARLRPAAGPLPATWPSWTCPVFGIAIDNVAGDGLRVGPLEAFTVPGSDHRGLRFRVAPR